MTTAQPEPRKLKKAERDALIEEARVAGEIPYDVLDSLLLSATSSARAFKTLLEALDGVRLVDSDDPEDILNQGLTADNELPSLSRDHFGLYADQVRSVPRMTRAEEHALARRLEFVRARLELALGDVDLDEDTSTLLIEHGTAGRDIDSDLMARERETERELRRRRNRLPGANPWAALNRAREEFARLRSHFVERNLYLVIGMCSAYRTYGVPMMDLIQEGNAALIRAVEKFDWRKDVRFQTYAVLWIRQAVERLTTANRGIVRVPNYIQQKMRRLRREGKLPRNQKDMDIRDVSKQFDTTPEAAARLMETDRPAYSIDGKVGDSDDTFAGLLEAEQEELDLVGSEHELLGERLREVMSETLTDQECAIIEQRFGLDGQSPRTLDQIGQDMNVSRERIRQMQVKALSKLKKPRLQDALADFL